MTTVEFTPDELMQGVKDEDDKDMLDKIYLMHQALITTTVRGITGVVLGNREEDAIRAVLTAFKVLLCSADTYKDFESSLDKHLPLKSINTFNKIQHYRMLPLSILEGHVEKGDKIAKYVIDTLEHGKDNTLLNFLGKSVKRGWSAAKNTEGPKEVSLIIPLKPLFPEFNFIGGSLNGK